MRYVVKDKETGWFLSRGGQWTPFITQAQKFPNGLSINLHFEGITLPEIQRFQVLELSPR